MNETITSQDQQATKFCTRCNRELPVSDFYKNKSNSDGRHSYCKSCFNEYYKQKNAEAVTPPESRKSGIVKLHASPADTGASGQGVSRHAHIHERD